MVNSIDWNRLKSIHDPNQAIISMPGFWEYVRNEKKIKKQKDWITKRTVVSCGKKGVVYKMMKHNLYNNVL